MKAEHRHDLKTNALADWLGHFPQWVKSNLMFIILVAAMIVVGAGYYFWKSGSDRAHAQERMQLTSLVNQIANGKRQVLNPQMQGASTLALFLNPANALQGFADATDNDSMAAMALVKRGEAFRAELHYRSADVSNEDLLDRLAKAKNSYTIAAAKAKSAANPSLEAAAILGLGLCEEEFGNFDAAKQWYTRITEDPDSKFEGTVAVAQAKLRLDTMSDYASNVVFQPMPRPRPKPVTPVTPIQLGPVADVNAPARPKPAVDANAPVDSNAPTDANQPPKVDSPAEANQVTEVSLPEQEPNKAIETPVVKPAVEEPNAPIAVPDVNAAAPDTNSTPRATTPNVMGR